MDEVGAPLAGVLGVVVLERGSGFNEDHRGDPFRVRRLTMQLGGRRDLRKFGVGRDACSGVS